MTAPDPRLDEIQARLDAANAELDRLTEGNPGTNWRWSIPANPERDSDLILSASIADVHFLLAELRKAHEALDEYVAKYGEHTTDNQGRGCPACAADIRVRSRERAAAVAAAKGDEQ